MNFTVPSDIRAYAPWVWRLPSPVAPNVSPLDASISTG